MSFGPIISEQERATTIGAQTDTGTLFVTGAVGTANNLTSANLITSMDDFEGYYTDRTVAASVPLYDYLDGAFGEGLQRCYVGAYAATGGKTYADGLALFEDDRLGPGQIAHVGPALTAQIATDTATICDATNKVGLLDVASGATIAQMETSGDLVPDNSEKLGVFGSWVKIPPPEGVIGGAARTIPASAILAALCNQADATGNPNRAPIGPDFPLQYATDVLLDPASADRVALWQHGVNAFMNDFGTLEAYGFQTNVPETPDSPFWQLNCSRARMWLKANAKVIAAPFYGRSIDGGGRLVSRLMTPLNAMCNQLWGADGLYGDTPEDAYQLTPIVTPTDAANATIEVTAEVRFSLYAKRIKINLVSVPILGTFS